MDNITTYADAIQSDILVTAHEWAGEGQGIDNPTAVQLAHVIRLEADFQDICVAAGESDPDYPAALRLIADRVESGQISA